MNQPPQMLVDVARELEQAGALPGQDFWVHFVTTGMGSSEFYGLEALEDGSFKVYYKDMGQVDVLEQTADAYRARAVFVDRVLVLAGLRGSGPRAVDRQPLVPLRPPGTSPPAST